MICISQHQKECIKKVKDFCNNAEGDINENKYKILVSLAVIRDFPNMFEPWMITFIHTALSQEGPSIDPEIFKRGVIWLNEL